MFHDRSVELLCMGAQGAQIPLQMVVGVGLKIPAVVVLLLLLRDAYVVQVGYNYGSYEKI